MFEHNGKQYDSKAAIIRAMYDAGEMKNDPKDKNRVAALLGMTVQTVHATLVRHLVDKRVGVVVPKPVYNKPTYTPPPVYRDQYEGYTETMKGITGAFDRCYEVAKSKGFDLPKIEIKWDLKGTCAGQFCTRFNRMFFRVNLELARRNLESYIKQTVPHEFCHYIVRKATVFRAQPHGYEWQSMMTRVFNLRPDRCHSYDTTGCRRNRQTFKYKCACKEYNLSVIRHRRIQMGMYYTCKRCHTKLVVA